MHTLVNFRRGAKPLLAGLVALFLGLSFVALDTSTAARAAVPALTAAGPASSSGPMIMTFRATASDLEIETSLQGTVNNITVNWGDGQISGPFNGAQNPRHTYATPGDYSVQISGTQLSHYGNYGYSAEGIVQVASWGSLGITDLSYAMAANSVLESVPSTLPPGVTNLSYALVGASNWNQDISNWDVSQVTDMSGLFFWTKFSGDLSGWNTQSLVTTAFMFYDDTEFNVDISPWNVSNLQDAHGMFQSATSFNQPIGAWTTTSLTNTSSMFMGANSFNQDLSNWDTHLVTDMSNMFPAVFNNGGAAGDTSHPLRTVGNKWNTSSVQNFNGLFHNTQFNQDIGNWNVTAATNMGSMFQDSVFNRDISGWNPVNVTAMDYMFAGSQFNNGGQPLIADATHWNLLSVTNMSWMFAGSPFNQNISSWNPVSATGLWEMFTASQFNNGGQPLTWNTSAFVNVENMFRSAPIFNQPIASWDVSHVTNMRGMFNGATAFNQSLNGWDVSHVTDMGAMFANTANFNGDLSNWAPTSVTDMSAMFANASAFNKPIASWNVSNVTSFQGMFSSAAAFNQPLNAWTTTSATTLGMMFNSATAFNQSLSNWDVSDVTYFAGMFQHASAFNGSLAGWDVSQGTDFSWMFNDASAFNQPLSTWTTTNMVNTYAMFFQASAFNQNIGTWDISHLQVADYMLRSTALSATNYSALLSAWANKPHLTNVNIHADPATYLQSAVSDRATLAATWNIYDNGLLTLHQSTITTPPAASAITYGQSLTSSTLTGGTADVAGAFAFTTGGQILGAGTHTVSVTFTPTDSVANVGATTSISIVVNKAARTLTFPSVNSTTARVGQPFAIASNLSATNDPVVFSVTPASSGVCTIDPNTGVVTPLGVGTCTINGAVAETGNYLATSASASVTISTSSRQPAGSSGSTTGGSSSGESDNSQNSQPEAQNVAGLPTVPEPTVPEAQAPGDTEANGPQPQASESPAGAFISVAILISVLVIGIVIWRLRSRSQAARNSR